MISPGEYILPTVYNGIKYRSRTEARWARFFVAAGIRFTYEPETFSLKCGKYLPDFVIDAFGGRQKIYAEVKGGLFSEKERERCKQLCESTKCSVIMLDGPPDFKCYGVFEWTTKRDCKDLDNCYHKDPFSAHSSCPCGEIDLVYETLAILCTSQCKYFPFFYCPGFEDKYGYFNPSDWYDDHADAITQAQNERFGVYQ